MKGYIVIAKYLWMIGNFFLQKLSQQIQSGLVPLSDMETIFIQFIREFPEQEQMKIFDLFFCFSMAKRHTRDLHFNFQWLLKTKIQYDPMTDADLDVLKIDLKSSNNWDYIIFIYKTL